MAEDPKSPNAAALAAKAEFKQKLFNAAVAAGPEFRALLSTLDAEQTDVLVKNNIVDQNGLPITTDFVTRTQDGAGGTETYSSFEPKVRVDTLRRLLALDPTPDHRWTRWIFHQAGGGRAAMELSENAYQLMLTNFTVRQRTKKLPEDRFKASLERVKPEFRRIAFSCDEDLLEKYKNCFGWARSFPGYANRYENVEKAMKAATAVFKRLKQANKALEAHNETPVSTEPSDYADIEALNAMVLRVTRAEAALYTRSDVRIGKWATAGETDPAWKKRNTVYADDNLSLVVPLTYAAAVEYGYGRWDVSNRDHFERTITGPDPGGPSNVWRAATQPGGQAAAAIGILTFDVPVPAWAYVKDKQYAIRTLSRLQLRLSTQVGQTNVDDIAITDEDAETTGSLSPQDIRDLIYSEVGREERSKSFDVAISPYDIANSHVEEYLQNEGLEMANEATDEVLTAIVTAGVGMARAKLDGVAAELAREQSPKDASAVSARLVNAALAQAAARAEKASAAAPEGVRKVVAQKLHAQFQQATQQADATFRSASLIDRGADVYQTREEAEAVVASFDAALEAFVRWIRANRDELPDMYRLRPSTEPKKKRAARTPKVSAEEEAAEDAAG